MQQRFKDQASIFAVLPLALIVTAGISTLIGCNRAGEL